MLKWPLNMLLLEGFSCRRREVNMDLIVMKQNTRSMF